MILSGCWTNPSNPEIKFVSIPESLLQEFCPEWKSAGDTVGTLAEGYVANTLCGKKYEAQVKEQKEFIKKMKADI